MDNSRFAQLPAERRNYIWELALQHEGPIVLTLPHENSAFRVAPALQGKNFDALTRTCKQIRKESRLLFFHINTFNFQHKSKFSLDLGLRRWVDQVGRGALAAMSGITFTVRFEFDERDQFSEERYEAEIKKVAKNLNIVKALAGIYGANVAKIEMDIGIRLRRAENVQIGFDSRDWDGTRLKAKEEIIGALDEIDDTQGLLGGEDYEDITLLWDLRCNLPFLKDLLAKYWKA